MLNDFDDIITNTKSLLRVNFNVDRVRKLITTMTKEIERHSSDIIFIKKKLDDLITGNKDLELIEQFGTLVEETNSKISETVELEINRLKGDFEKEFDELSTKCKSIHNNIDTLENKHNLLL